jgi:UDP-N-acetylglucosamine acyltransferase
VTVAGNPAKPHGINSEGLKRRGYSAEGIAAIKRAYRALYRSGLTLDEARQRVAEIAAGQAEAAPFAAFIADSGRGIVR